MNTEEQLLKIKTMVHDIAIDVTDGNKSRSSDNKTTYTLMFLSGTVFGMSDEKWRPYAGYMWDIGKEILTRG